MISADDARREGLRLAVDLWEDRNSSDLIPDVERTALAFARILTGTPAEIKLGSPFITEQATGLRVPLHRTGADMAVTITDTQIATYAVTENDTKGFPVTDPITWTEDSGGTVVASDGSGGFSAVAPGTANITASDGTLSATDAITVDPSAPTSLVLGAPVITEQA